MHARPFAWLLSLFCWPWVSHRPGLSPPQPGLPCSELTTTSIQYVSRRLAFWSAMSLLDCIIAICKESNDRQQHPIGHIALLFEFEITIHRFIIHTRQEHSATIVSSTTPLAYLPEPNNKTADTVFFFLHKKWKKRSFCPTAKAYVSIQNQPITTQAKVGRKEWPAPCR